MLRMVDKKIFINLQNAVYLDLWVTLIMRVSRGGQGVQPPLKDHKNLGLLSNTGPDPLKKKNPKIPSQNSMLGHHLHSSETPFKFKWRFVGGPMMACWILPSLIN